MWGARFANKRIILHTDNMALTFIINKLTSTDSKIMVLVRKLTLLTLKFNILFHCEHIIGKKNFLAGALSRLQFQEFHLVAPHMHKHPSRLPEDLRPENFSLV
jgi:hypothetical protein